MATTSRESRWDRLSARHKKKYKIMIGFLSAAVLVGTTYKTWYPYAHEVFTPEFSIEIHRTWNYDNAYPPMTTPYRSARTGKCGDDRFDELAFVEVRNNHEHKAILRSMKVSVHDEKGWHDGHTMKSLTRLVFLPDMRQCAPGGPPGATGCYVQLNGEYRLDSALPRMPLPQDQNVTGYVELKWDDEVNPVSISEYEIVTIDAKGEKSTIRIKPPNAEEHKNDEIYAVYDRFPAGWEPDCGQINPDADR